MSVRECDSLYIGGGWTRPESAERIPVENPATESVVATVPAGTDGDVDRAVRSARQAFSGWSRTPVADRAGCLQRLADGLTARHEELARTITTEIGAPLRIARSIQAGLPITVTQSIVDLLADYDFEERIGHSLVVKEPVGVVGAITPWNYPLHQVVAKVAPALAAGATVVLKPSEVAPLCTFLLAEIMHDAGFPPGVFNLVTGYGPTVGAAIAGHPDVDLVSFTGSVRAGTAVSAAAAATVKKVTLELGGKSANLVLPDADLATAVKVGVGSAFLNSGQTCTALTRMIVPESRYDEAMTLAVEAARRYPPGDPMDEDTRLGPLVSGAQRERVRRYIERGVADGAELVHGGAEPPAGAGRGYYVRPTVFGHVRTEMAIAQEEIFGPVLAVLSYTDEDEAIGIANDSRYGLAGAVWSGDQEHAVAVARRIRSGQVDINGGRFNPVAPFGGFKQSGHGRELGRYGLEEFLQPKALQL